MKAKSGRRIGTIAEKGMASLWMLKKIQAEAQGLWLWKLTFITSPDCPITDPVHVTVGVWMPERKPGSVIKVIKKGEQEQVNRGLY